MALDISLIFRAVNIIAAVFIIVGGVSTIIKGKNTKISYRKYAHLLLTALVANYRRYLSSRVCVCALGLDLFGILK